ncbi:hypothetical protein [Mesorhizobium cantuariense]|uniref:Uncharacterized protein n=1 Tax=Mesorhizobium cantuariense TaxID=1300275 RepID=A0ABV7MVJ6_9HYPH
MSQTRFSLQNRLLLLKEEYGSTAVGVAFFCAFALAPIVHAVQMQNNPVTATQRVTGVVEYIRAPINPKAAAGRGLYYTYDVRLDDSKALIFIDDDVGTPHPVGSVLPLERQHHKNGTDTYRLLEG